MESSILKLPGIQWCCHTWYTQLLWTNNILLVILVFKFKNNEKRPKTIQKFSWILVWSIFDTKNCFLGCKVHDSLAAKDQSLPKKWYILHTKYPIWQLDCKSLKFQYSISNTIMTLVDFSQLASLQHFELDSMIVSTQAIPCLIATLFWYTTLLKRA